MRMKEMRIVNFCRQRLLTFVLCLAVLLSAVPAWVLQTSAASGHTAHCLCGATHKSIGDHTAAESVSFTAWTNTDSLPWESGNYYLTTDYNLTRMWAIQTNKNIVLCLNGHTIRSDNFDWDYDSVISIQSGSKLTITDCKGSGTVRSHKSDTPSVKVYDRDASARIFGGTYTGKDTGLFVDAGNADVYGGTFKSNAYYGIFLRRSSWPKINKTTVNVYNATIQSNGSSSYTTVDNVWSSGGGIYVQTDCTLNLYDTTISGNYGSLGGGIGNMGTVNMSGGTIRSNHANKGGGVYNYGTFTMTGGSISGNSAVLYGGGVYNCNKTDAGKPNALFTLQDGSITGNSAVDGGGIANYQAYGSGTTTLRMKGGSVSNNTATGSGAGIYSNSYDNTLELSGGSITGNQSSSTSDTDYAGGVCVNTNTTLQMQGNITVSGNTKNGAASNIYLKGGSRMTVPAALTGSLGVSIPGTKAAVAKGSGYWLTETDKAKFTSDADGYEFVLIGNTIRLQKILTPVATGDFTFVAPADLTYTGTAKTAEVTGKSGIGAITVKYYDSTGKKLTGAPVDAGTYTVKIDVAESDEYAAVTDLTDAGWKFTIAPKGLSEKDVTVTGIESDYIYTGNSVQPIPAVVHGDKTLVQDADYTVSYDENILGIGSVTVTFCGNYTGTAAYTFKVDYGVLDETMYTMPAANENGWYNRALTVSAKTGYTVGLSTAAFADGVQLVETGADKTLTLYAKAADGGIYRGTLVYSLDEEAPTDLEIRYNNSAFRKLLNTLTFGLFFKDTVTVEARATDALSGVDTVRYYAAESAVDDPAAITDWVDSLHLTPTAKKIVYVEVTDKAGNRTIANDQGVVLYTDSTAAAVNDTFDLNADKQADVQLRLTLNGNTFIGVKNGTQTLNTPADYVVNGDTLVVSKAYLAQFADGDTVTLTLSFAPLGVSGDTVSEAAVTIHVTDTTDYHRTAVKSDYAAAACETEGHEAYWHCPVCGKYFADNDGEIDTTTAYDTADRFTLSVLGHDFTKEIVDDEHRISAATCTERAVYCYGCTRCDEKDTTKTYKHGDPLGHDFTEKLVDDEHWISAATCTEQAVYCYDCSRCDVKDTAKTYRHGDPLGHDFTEKIVDDAHLISAATCTEQAVYCYDCSRCDEKDTAKTYRHGDPLGHSFSDYRYNNDATYFADGTETAACDHTGCTLKDTRTCKNSRLIDTGLPTAAITVGEHTWSTLISAPVFELFHDGKQTVTIAYADGESGLESAWYYISDAVVSDLTTIEWQPYTAALTLDADGTYVIYAKAADKVGNTAIVCSEGLVLDTVAPQLSVKDGATFCEKVTIQITEEYLASVTVDGETVDPEDGAITLTAGAEPQVVVVTDKAGNRTQVTVTVNAEHTFTDSKITTPATVIAEGVRTWYCQYCDATKTESVEKLPPEIIDGANGAFTRSVGDGLTFRSNAALADFLHVAVDGEILSADKYTLSEGSTIVKLTAEYLNTLKAGTHTLAIQSASGTATTEFTISEKPNPGLSPETGDPADPVLWSCLAAVLLATAALAVLRRRRKGAC